MTGNYYEDYCEEPERKSIPVYEYDELLQSHLDLEERNDLAETYLCDIIRAIKKGDRDEIEELAKDAEQEMGYKSL